MTGRGLNRHRIRHWLDRAGLYASVVLLVSPALLFFLWMLSLSLKNELDNTAYPPVFIPNPPTLANFVRCVREERLPDICDQLG